MEKAHSLYIYYKRKLQALCFTKYNSSTIKIITFYHMYVFIWAMLEENSMNCLLHFWKNGGLGPLSMLLFWRSAVRSASVFILEAQVMFRRSCSVGDEKNKSLSRSPKQCFSTPNQISTLYITYKPFYDFFNAVCGGGWRHCVCVLEFSFLFNFFSFSFFLFFW